MTRSELAGSFVASAGWAGAAIVPLAGDASNRRYDRLTRPDGSTSVLMDAPPETGEDVAPFVRIARHLGAIGLSAPEIYAQDEIRGFLLIEDLGDALFAREIRRDPTSESTLYHAAADVLAALHRHPAPHLPVYDAETTVPLAALAYDWYFFGASGHRGDAACDRFKDAFGQIIAPFDSALTVLIQRDYHAENLLWLPQRTGVARVGLLDFQDAMLGHPCYDLVSILQDARRDVTPKMQTAMFDYFVKVTGQPEDEFSAAYAIFGAQRNLRILGVFARLCMRDGKAHYVDLIPRVWNHVLTNLRHEALAPVADILLTDLPAPEKAVLNTIKEKCGTCAGR